MPEVNSQRWGRISVGPPLPFKFDFGELARNHVGLYPTFLDFRSRTARLAARKRVKIKDLPLILGISRATLFACKATNAVISEAVWAKLDEAEFLAGINTPAFEQHLANIAESAKVAEASPGTEEEKTAVFDRVFAELSSLRAGLDRLEKEVAALRALPRSCKSR